MAQEFWQVPCLPDGAGRTGEEAGNQSSKFVPYSERKIGNRKLQQDNKWQGITISTVLIMGHDEISCLPMCQLGLMGQEFPFRGGRDLESS